MALTESDEYVSEPVATITSRAVAIELVNIQFQFKHIFSQIKSEFLRGSNKGCHNKVHESEVDMWIVTDRMS